MDKVWVLCVGVLGLGEPVAVFTDQRAAKATVKRCQRYWNLGLREISLNYRPLKPWPEWVVHVDVQTGKILKKARYADAPDIGPKPPRSSKGEITHWREVGYVSIGHSFVSSAEALRLARAARTKWLKEQGAKP